MKLKSINDLHKWREEVISRKSGSQPNEDAVQIKVGMATCGFASGAKEIMNFISEECEQQALDVVVSQTGCIGYCYAEPVIEVLLPGNQPKIFGFVNKSKAREIIEKYIMQGEDVEGEIPISFQTVTI